MAGLSLVEDEEHGGWLIPMMMLCHEHDADPKMRPQPITPREARGHHRAHGAGLVGRIGISSAPKSYVAIHPRLSLGARPPRSGGTSVSVRFGKEIQKVLRRGDRELSYEFLEQLESSKGRLELVIAVHGTLTSDLRGFRETILDSFSNERVKFAIQH